MDPDEIRKKGNKIVGFEHRSRSGKTTELLGIYNMPDPNSPMNRLIRYMGKLKKSGTTQGRNNPRKGVR